MGLRQRGRSRRTIRLELTAGELEHVQEAVQQYLYALPSFQAESYGLQLITMWFKICRQIRRGGGHYAPLRSLPRWAEPLVADAVLRLSQRAREELPSTLRVIPGTAAAAAGGGTHGEARATHADTGRGARDRLRAAGQQSGHA